MDKLISMNEKVSLIAGFAKMAMGEDPVHGWPHVLRVAKYCEIIMSSLKKEINKEILALSILLHDIGRFYKAEVHHAITSSKLAGVLLKGLGYDEDFIEEVVHAILAHSFSLGIKAKTIEAKILSDADKLDALGAIGIYRTIYESGRTRRGYSETLRHFREKILILIDKLYLPESKKIAEKLNRRVELYVSWLSDELDNLT